MSKISSETLPITQITDTKIVIASPLPPQDVAANQDGTAQNENDGNVVPRCPSPRLDNTTIERKGRERVKLLQHEAELIQESLSGILERVGQAKDDCDRLSSENRFLQDYIGNLMSTSNILHK